MNLQPPANIADDALELLRATRERINHMQVLFNSIIKDLKHGTSRDIEELASLGGFLGNDWATYIDSEVESMQKALDAVEDAA